MHYSNESLADFLHRFDILYYWLQITKKLGKLVIQYGKSGIS